MNKYILGGAVIIIIVIAFLMLNNKTSPSNTALVPESESVQKVLPNSSNEIVQIVTYTDNGFSPSELIIKAGTSVTFKNESSAKLWVASAPHPAHTQYPEFDQKTEISKGGSYTFTFNKVGTHPYHNHVLLGKYGKITVE